MESRDHGKFDIEFPEDMSLEEIFKHKHYIFKYLERHNCRITYRAESSSSEVINEQNTN